MSTAEDYILSIVESVGGAGATILELTYDHPGATMTPPSSPRYPGRGNHLARRAAATLNRLVARDATRPALGGRT